MPHVASYARTSIDKTQTVENELRQLNEVAALLGWTVVQVCTDEGISGTKGWDRRPAFNNLMKGIIRETAPRTKSGTASVMRIKQSLEARAA